MDCSMCTLIPTILVILVCYKIFKSLLFPKTYVAGWSNKYVLITGCDSGFGRAIAVKLDQLGLHVFAACLTEEGVTSLREECSDRVKTLMLDVTSSDQIRRACEEVQHILPPNTGLWGLVNNAGVGFIGPVEWMPMSEFKRVADVNLWGTIDMTKTFLPLIKQAHGHVVNMSSVGGRFSGPLYAAYSLSKFGVEAFSDALRAEMFPWGVRVSLIEPGGFLTSLTGDNALSKGIEKYWGKLGDEMKEEYGEDYLKTACNSINTLSKDLSADLSPVVNAVTDALLLLSPPTRCVMGPNACMLLLPTYMPDWLRDWFVRQMFKFSGCDFVPNAARKSMKNE